MGLPLYTSAHNRAFTIQDLDETIDRARRLHVLFVMGAKSTEKDLNYIQTAAHTFETFTTQISDLEAELEASRVNLRNCRTEARELDEELQWALRYRHRGIITTTGGGGGDIVSRDPDTVEGELAVLLVHIKDQSLAIDGLQHALEEKQEAWAYWQSRCRDLSEETARHVEIVEGARNSVWN